MTVSKEELFTKLTQEKLITDNFNIRVRKKGFYLTPKNKLFRCKYLYLEYIGVDLINTKTKNDIMIKEYFHIFKNCRKKITFEKFIGLIYKKLTINYTF